jgi:alpha-L-arabinofuranosidase
MSATVRMRLHPEVPSWTVSKYLYGHFAEHLGRCIYNGIWVGEKSPIPNEGGLRTDTLEALRAVALPVLRWPGGCYADNYHWRDGIGPRDRRKARHNMHWAQPESNQFGTDEFLRFCKLIETEPYICLNVGSGDVEEARSWVEYCNANQHTAITEERAANGHPEPYRVPFWGIGNENWGCGGCMQPEYYADLYARFAGYVKGTAGPGGKMIACGSHPGNPEWDRRFMERLERVRALVDYLAVHNYPNHGTPAKSLDFTDDHYHALVIDGTASMVDQVRRTAGVARAFSSGAHRVGVILDEWGTWFRDATVENGLYQQSTMLDALFTADAFHAFHLLGEDLFMANMAQTVNVLQALVLTEGPNMIVTPTYHVYEMYKPHRDGRHVPCEITGSPEIISPSSGRRDAVSASATRNPEDGSLFLSIVNLDLSAEATASVDWCAFTGFRVAGARRLATGSILSHNTFDAPDTVKPEALDPAGIDLASLRLPAQSVTTLTLIPDSPGK